jgi:hypothetical protein
MRPIRDTSQGFWCTPGSTWLNLPEPTRLSMRLFGQENFEAAPVRDVGGAPVTR